MLKLLAQKKRRKRCIINMNFFHQFLIHMKLFYLAYVWFNFGGVKI